MLWPPPERGARVGLACRCEGRVQWRVPLVFVYRISIGRTDASCARHSPGRRSFVGLEHLTSEPRPDSQI